MRNNLPPRLFSGAKICVICEGNEEYAYLRRLDEINFWSSKIQIFPTNAEGNGNLFARFQDQYQSDNYDLVLIFCDTDKKPFKQFEEIKNKINDMFDNENAYKHVIIYSNPCILQIVLLHWECVALTTQAKKKNAIYVEEYTGVCGYKAREDQLDEIYKQITLENCDTLIKNLEKIHSEEYDKSVSSTNFLTFLQYFRKDDTQWIDEINRYLEP